MSLLRVVGKLYSTVQMKRVRAGTEYAIGEEQFGLHAVQCAWTKCFP